MSHHTTNHIYDVNRRPYNEHRQREMPPSEQRADPSKEAAEHVTEADEKSSFITPKDAHSSEVLAVSAEMPSRTLSKARLGVIAVEIRNPASNRKTKVYAIQGTCGI